MKIVRQLALVCLVLGTLGGCYAAHRPAPSARADAGSRIDSGFDAGRDAGVDAGPPYEPPPGVCRPPDEWRTARVPGDTQRQRDIDQATGALSARCNPGESCTSVELEVAADGVVVATTPDESTTQECADETLLGLCLPTLADGIAEIRVCGF
ncbi:MAG TPA: hypothetical protein ENK57_16720 [Polyangiaceae bacterium]|nr:hypothetical protein [Polyangiaceae bacterium]